MIKHDWVDDIEVLRLGLEEKDCEYDPLALDSLPLAKLDTTIRDVYFQILTDARSSP